VRLYAIGLIIYSFLSLIYITSLWFWNYRHKVILESWMLGNIHSTLMVPGRETWVRQPRDHTLSVLKVVLCVFMALFICWVAIMMITTWWPSGMNLFVLNRSFDIPFFMQGSTVCAFSGIVLLPWPVGSSVDIACTNQHGVIDNAVFLILLIKLEPFWRFEFRHFALVLVVLNGNR